jgi:hypothetical protein
MGMNTALRFCYLFLVCIPLAGFGQSSLGELEDSLRHYAAQMQHADTAEVRLAAAEKVRYFLEEALAMPGADTYSFEQAPQISIQTSEGAPFRLFTWQVMEHPDRFHHFGILQMTGAHRRLIRLHARRSLPPDADTRSFSASEWPGAVYYNIMPIQTRTHHYWLLFGFDQFAAHNNRKILDVLHFDEAGEPVFGAPVLIYPASSQRPMQEKHRLILEYASDARVRLNFDKHWDLILFDHLEVFADPAWPGRLRYIPDGTYSGFKLKRGLWYFQEKVFDKVLDEAPVEFPVLEGRRNKDIFGRDRKMDISRDLPSNRRSHREDP